MVHESDILFLFMISSSIFFFFWMYVQIQMYVNVMCVRFLFCFCFWFFDLVEKEIYFVTIPSFSCSSSGSRCSAQLAGVLMQNIRRFASSFRTRRRHTTNTQNINTPWSAFNMSVMNLLQS